MNWLASLRDDPESGFGCEVGKTGGGIAIQTCVMSDSVQELKILLRGGAGAYAARDDRGILNAWERDGEGNTVVHTAAELGEQQVINLFIKAFRDEVQTRLDPVNNQSQSPLHFAARCGHEGIVQLLLSHGKCSATRRDARGWSALHCAALAGHVGICKQLLARGSDAFSFDSEQSKQSPANIAESNWKRLTAELKDLKTLKADCAQKRRSSILADPAFIQVFFDYHGSLLRKFWPRCTWEVQQELKVAKRLAASLRRDHTGTSDQEEGTDDEGDAITSDNDDDDDDDDDDNDDDSAATTSQRPRALLPGSSNEELATGGGIGSPPGGGGASTDAAEMGTYRSELHQAIVSFPAADNGNEAAYDCAEIHYKLLRRFRRLNDAVLREMQSLLRRLAEERGRFSAILDVMTPGWDTAGDKKRDKKKKKGGGSKKGSKKKIGAGGGDGDDLNWMTAMEQSSEALLLESGQQEELQGRQTTTREAQVLATRSANDELAKQRTTQQQKEEQALAAENRDNEGFYGSMIRLGGHCDGELRRPLRDDYS